MEFSALIQAAYVSALTVVAAMSAVAAVKVVVDFARWAYSQVIDWFAPSLPAYEDSVVYVSSGGVQWSRGEIEELKENYAAYPDDLYGSDDLEVIRKYS